MRLSCRAADEGFRTYRGPSYSTLNSRILILKDPKIRYSTPPVFWETPSECRRLRVGDRAAGAEDLRPQKGGALRTVNTARFGKGTRPLVVRLRWCILISSVSMIIRNSDPLL